MLEKISDIEKIANIIQAPVYWANLEGVLIGANEATVHSFGFGSAADLLGKKISNFFIDGEAACALNHICNHIRKTGKVYKHKELIKNNKTGQLHCFKSVKSPLRDN